MLGIASGGGGNPPRVLTLPLLPHRAVAERRRPEPLPRWAGRRRLSEADDGNGADRRAPGGGGGTERGASVSPTTNSSDSRPPSPRAGAALYQGYGTHYVDLWIGTPPQRQTVIVDTGESSIRRRI